MEKTSVKKSDFYLGVNYWPRKKAMYWWKDFSEKEVEIEFRQIKSLNLSLVRIFLLWEDFQPKPNQINIQHIRHLQTVLEIADSQNLKILIALFTGHMSGVNWVPDWALSNKKLLAHQYRTFSKNKLRNVEIGYFYRDPHLLKAQRYFLKKLIPQVRHYPALWGWDLGNEPSILVMPRKVQDVVHWVKILSKEIKTLDPAHPITLGIHQGDFACDTKFHPGLLRQYLDIPSMHGYPNYSNWARNPLDSMSLSFLNFLTEQMTQKKVLFAEFGLPIPPDKEIQKLNQICSQFFATEDEGYIYFKEGLQHLYKIGSLGALLWCFSDYHPSLKKLPPFDKAPHELYFGITKSDGKLKKTGKALIEWGEKMRQIHPAPKLKYFPLKDYYRSPERNLGRLYRIFLSHCERKRIPKGP